MDLKDIKALAKLLNESGLTAVEVVNGDTKIRVERNIVHNTVANYSAPTADLNSAPLPIAEQAQNLKPGGIDFNNVYEFRSPIIGTFFAQPSPDAKPFVSLGSRVKKGDVLCIIEAMKVMNEITSDRDGEIVDICVNNGAVVEFSQVLFKIF